MPSPSENFLADRRGGVAIVFGLMLVPLMLFAGASVDLMRAVDLRTQLQMIADTAALAGATAYGPSITKAQAEAVASNYVTSSRASLPANGGFKSTVTCTANGTSASSYGCTVAISANLMTSLMAIVTNSIPVSATATAQSPVYSVQFTFGSFASSAYDFNSIYWYIVPNSGGIPASSALTLLYCNKGCGNTDPTPPQITAGQKIGFLLRNVTGGITPYGANGHGGLQGSTHDFYSHLSPPSSRAYSSVSQNCSLQAETSTTSTANRTAITTGSCFSTTPVIASLNCSRISGKTVTLSWNDMGGGTEDYDYNDAVHKVTCTPVDPSYQSAVVLTK